MELSEFIAFLCFWGPTPLAALLAGWQASQCRSAWHAFFVAALGTMALAVAFAVAADYLPGHGQVFGTLRVWQVHLILSPLVGVPVGLFCAYWVRQRNVPSNDQVG